MIPSQASLHNTHNTVEFLANEADRQQCCRSASFANLFPGRYGQFTGPSPPMPVSARTAPPGLSEPHWPLLSWKRRLNTGVDHADIISQKLEGTASPLRNASGHCL